MMRRLPWTCLAVGVYFAVAGLVQGQQVDEITYVNRTSSKEERIKGKITEESAAEVVCQVGSQEVRVPARDIVDVLYHMGPAARLEFRRAAGQETKAQTLLKPEERVTALDAAVTGYRDVLPQLAEWPLAQRQVEFLLARALARKADGDDKHVKAALTALAAFKAKHPNSWQLRACGKLLFRLYRDQGDWRAAEATMDSLLRGTELPAELRNELGLLMVHALLNANRIEAAEKRLAALAGTIGPNGPFAMQARIYQAACQSRSNFSEAEKRLKGVLIDNTDDATRALAYNTLGDSYLRQQQPYQAFWQYLWVDVHYNQDREEHAKALYQLSKLFAQVRRNPARAKACLDRLLTEPAFDGTEYRRRAAKEIQQAATDRSN